LKLLGNPAVLGALLLLIAGAGAFIIGVVLIRRMRQELMQTSRPAPRTESPAFALQAYNAVIQQLKEKETELQRLRQTASERASATDNISSAVINNLPSGVALFTPTGLVQQANPAAKDILGYGTASGLHARDLFRGASSARGEAIAEELQSLPAVIDACLKNGRVFRRLEADYTTPAGQRRVLGITVSPVTANTGERLGAACLITDLTHVTELSRQLRLREQLAAMGEMSAGMAHEFKNSLATIAGYSQMLADESDPATIRQFAGKICGETAALTKTVTEFLNLTRPQKLTSEPVLLKSLLESCANDCGVRLDASAVSPDLSLNGDPAALRQCFLNLFRNSAEAAPGRQVRVTARASSDGTLTAIELHDDAGGIAPDLLPRVFIPFVSGKPEGNGLGLALAHRIVSDHGGTISARNEGTGAVFTLGFPQQNPAKSAIE